MSEWKRIKNSTEEPEQKETSKKSKESLVEFFPEEPKYTFDEVILPQSVKEKI